MADGEVKTFKFRVEMTCNACLEAVKRSLNRSLGPEKLVSVTGDLQEQSVVVQTKGPEDEQQVLNLVAKAGKKTELFK